MTRWLPGKNSPKHLQKIGDETVLARIVRQVRQVSPDAEIFITSHDERYEVPGAIRYEPHSNRMEIDRFTWELIDENTCFLYGDTFYSDEAIEKIGQAVGTGLLFFSAGRNIVAVDVFDAQQMREQIEKVRADYMAGRIQECKGWQIYHSVIADGADPAVCMVQLNDETQGFNTTEEYETLLKTISGSET